MTDEKPPGLRKAPTHDTLRNHPYAPDPDAKPQASIPRPARPRPSGPLDEDLALIERVRPVPGHGLDFYELTIAPPHWSPDDAEAGCLCGQTWGQAPRQVVLYALIAHLVAAFYPPGED